jgi:hypothetical protein
MLEPHAAQRLERARIVVAAGEDEVAARRAERLALDEEVLIVLHNTLQRGAIALLKGGALLPHQGGDGGDPLLRFGHDMGLLVTQHLQPVLDRTQEPIGFGKITGGCLIDPAGGCQC